jgi:hypothetical protein
MAALRTIFSFLLLSLVCVVRAQTETFDIATYTPPAGWKKEVKETYVTYTDIKQNTGAFCVLAIYASKKSEGSAEKDFAGDWQQLVIQPFNATEKNPPAEVQTAGGWKATAAVSPITFNGATAYVLLTTFTGFGKSTSVLATLNDQPYLPIIESFLTALILDSTVVAASPATDLTNTQQLTGKWAKSASSPSHYVNGALTNAAYNGYYKGQYEFKKDSTYIFIGESYNGLNEFGLFNEKGTYKIKGQQVILSPSISSIRATDLNGKLKKTQALSKAKRTYSWKFHYFEGIQEHNLVLTADKENVIDGGYSSNPLFPHSFLYSREYKPEWKFNR